MKGQRIAYFGEQFVLHHLVADLDRRGITLGIGAAVALDDDAVEAKEDAAVGLPWVHLLGERPECIAREQIADPAPDRPRHRGLEMLRELTGGALRSLERDVARKPFRHHHIHGSLADVIALHEARIVEKRK